MLKIKDFVDLKELEKYGFKLVEEYLPRTIDVRSLEKGDYVKSDDIVVYGEHNMLYDRHIDTRYIDLDNMNIDVYEETLYDLIKDGLVEKVK